MDKAVRQQYLQAMEIQAWERRDRATPDAGIGMQGVENSPQAGHGMRDQGGDARVAGPSPQDVETLDWEALQQRVSLCTQCELHRSRTQTVFGVGDRRARLMIIGEAPGADEDRHGEPFVGRAGQLLDEMLRAIGLSRSQVYITNILKCRPPGNRDPHADEVCRCEPYLQRQIRLLQPALILAIGRVAAHNLLRTDASLAQLRGRIHHYTVAAPQMEIPLVVSYHPAYLLRTPRQKRQAWEDLQLAMRLLQGTAQSH